MTHRHPSDRAAQPTLTLVPFPHRTEPRITPLNPRQQDILDVVVRANTAISTRDVRQRVNNRCGTHLVLEQVYRVLRSLHDRDLIQRVRVDDTQHAHWRRSGSPAQRCLTHHRHPSLPTRTRKTLVEKGPER